jgi:hypothetical protein
MRFVRVTYSHTRGRVVAVSQLDVPFEGDRDGLVLMSGEDCEISDLGVVEPQDWTDLQGRPCRASRHILERLELGRDPELVRVHAVPCTINGIAAALRARGPAAIPPTVRAWLAMVLPADKVAAFGIGRGVPLSVLKAAETLRVRHDPRSGSRLPNFERYIQKRADIAVARRQARRDRAKAKGKD